MKKTIQIPAYQNLIKDFEGFLTTRNYQLGKGNMHRSAITELLIWMEEKGVVKIKDVGNEVVKYFEYLIERPNKRTGGVLSESTIKLHLYALSLFMQNLLANKVIDNGFYIPSYRDGFSTSRNVLTVDQIKTVYSYCENDLERALLSLAYGCGLRRNELERLNSKDIFLSSGELFVRKGKGDKRRTIPISDWVLVYVRKYFMDERPQRMERNKEIGDAFFINSKGKRADGEYLNDMLKEIIKRTNSFELIQLDITLHCLRHSIANHLAENNAGFDFIRRFLGHADINTTYLYAIKNKKRKPVVTF